MIKFHYFQIKIYVHKKIHLKNKIIGKNIYNYITLVKFMFYRI